MLNEIASFQKESVMQMIDGNPRRLQCANEEVITVTVVPNNDTVNAVTYNLNGSTWQGGSFTVDDTANKVSTLVVFMSYSDANGGGGYKITVRGSGGGDTSEDEVEQTKNPVTNKFRMEDARAYLFF
jgi:hypothetical protein